MVTFNRFSPNCTLPNETPIGFVNAPNIRTTMQIVWSCFSVILLCTWSILHLNVPPELMTRGSWQWIYRKLFLLFRKVYWMGVMLIAPEFLTTFMTKKMLGTKENVKALEELADEDDVEWTLSHTILADMGGIAIYFGPLPRRPSNGRSKHKPGSDPEALKALLSKEKSEKMVESYEFIKSFMRRQNRWLGGCEIPWEPYKAHFEHAENAIRLLPKDSLEWKTQNIAALSGSVWTLDSKQLAIARSEGVISKLPNIQLADIEDKNKSDPLVKLLAMMQVVWIVVQLCARVYYGLPFAPLELTTVAFSVTAIILYSSEWEKPKDVNTPVYVPAAEHCVTEEAFIKIAEAAPFPYMQFPYLQCKHYYMPSVSFHETDGKVSHIDAKSFLVALATVVSFGGIHLFAWNFHFPTPVEGLLWKISAIITIACPTLYVGSHLPFMGKTPKDVTKPTARKVKAVVAFTSFFYFFARLFLITESIRSLYYLPQEAFIATWTADFPHMT
ncbi:hypothetical protein TrVGV298_002180 [Trichoderma virens]|nr:hypothetical protein TrVGV298_002180 [Trichoderma virens]